MKRFMMIAAVVLSLGAGTKAFGQVTPSVNTNMQIEMPSALSMNWDLADSGASVLLTNTNAVPITDLARGYTDAINGGTLVIDANSAWFVTVSADSDYFVGGNGTKPLTDLSIDLNNAGAYMQLLGGTNLTLISSLVPSVDQLFKLNYKILWNQVDGTGIFQTNLYFTLYESI